MCYPFFVPFWGLSATDILNRLVPFQYSPLEVHCYAYRGGGGGGVLAQSLECTTPGL